MQAIEAKSTAHGGSLTGEHVTAKSRVSLRGGLRIALLSMLTLTIAIAAAGCGDERGDADAVTGTFQVKVVEWKFPKTQPLGKSQDFTLVVRNVDSKDVPQLALTIKGLRQFVEQGGAATNTRPVWVPNEVNYSNITPNSSSTGSTFNLGALAAGEQKTFVLPLTPIRRGEHRIGYVLAGNIYGTAKVELEDGNPAASMRSITIDPTPEFDESVFD